MSGTKCCSLLPLATERLLWRHDASKCWPGAENYEGRDPGSEHKWAAVRASDNNNHQTGPWWILFTNFWSGVIFSVLVSLTQIASQQTIIMTQGPGLTFIKIVFKILFCLRHQLAWRGHMIKTTQDCWMLIPMFLSLPILSGVMCDEVSVSVYQSSPQFPGSAEQ